ncbi:MAG: copper ion binding protein [Nitrospiria bacterium]
MDTATLNVQGMTCNHCVQTIKGALEKIDGVENVAVVLEKGEVRVKYDPALAKIDQFKTAIVESGYEVS